MIHKKRNIDRKFNILSDVQNFITVMLEQLLFITELLQFPLN